MNLQTSDRARAALVAWLCLASSSVWAKELDQFTDRLLELHYYAGGYRKLAGAPGPQQVDAVLDARMNMLLDRLQLRLRESPPRTAADRSRLLSEVFQHRFLPALVTPYEQWVKTEAPVPLYRVRDKGIFGHAVDYDDMRLAWYIELSPILRVGGVLMGIDKLGHFLAQGFQYYQHDQALSRRPDAARYAALRTLGHVQELGQLGIATGGVYSYADLAANWAGMAFFSSLFNAADIEGQHHARYFEPAGEGKWRRVRDFHWAEWVTPDWDEVLNPAATARRALYEKVAENFRRRPGPANAPRTSICDWYRRDPQAFLGPNSGLRPRSSYALSSLGMRVAPYALDVRALCSSPAPTTRTAPP